MNVVRQRLDELIQQDKHHECEGMGTEKICVRMVAVANLPTRFGEFFIVGFWNNRDSKEHIAMVHGDVVDQEHVPLRMHSECLTGDIMGSLRCDCRDQLEVALRTVAHQPCGVVLYLRQEGRGIGLLNKIRAYNLQEQGFDTVEANLALGFKDDERDFAVAAHMIHSLRIRSVKLMTNNPLKVNQLNSYGVKVVERIPLVIPPNDYNRFYLETKAHRSGHWIDLNGYPHLEEQSDPIVVKEENK
ncbi:MAG: GTP cyclohydrolase II [bacterium]|nr:GTP cyclohydrolase II [bacterium]